MKLRIGPERYTPLPDGLYRVVVSSIYDTRWEPYGPALEWVFEVMEGPFIGCRVKGKVNKGNGLGKRQKLCRWYYAITGRWPKEGDDVETDELIGKSCWAQITRKISSTKKPANHIDLVAKSDAHSG